MKRTVIVVIFCLALPLLAHSQAARDFTAKDIEATSTTLAAGIQEAKQQVAFCDSEITRLHQLQAKWQKHHDYLAASLDALTVMSATPESEPVRLTKPEMATTATVATQQPIPIPAEEIER